MNFNLDAADITQVAILYLIFYSVLRLSRGSRFGQALAGVGIFALAVGAISYFFNFNVLARILQSVLLYLLLTSVVIFQPEIRRLLASIGAL